MPGKRSATCPHCGATLSGKVLAQLLRSRANPASYAKGAEVINARLTPEERQARARAAAASRWAGHKAKRPSSRPPPKA